MLSGVTPPFFNAKGQFIPSRSSRPQDPLLTTIYALFTGTAQWRPQLLGPLNEIIVSRYGRPSCPEITHRLQMIFDRIFYHRTPADVLAPIGYDPQEKEGSFILSVLKDPWLWLMMGNYKQKVKVLPQEQQAELATCHQGLIELLDSLATQLEQYHRLNPSVDSHQARVACQQIQRLCASYPREELATTLQDHFPLQACILMAACGETQSVLKLMRMHQEDQEILGWGMAAAVANRHTACARSLRKEFPIEQMSPKAQDLILAVAHLARQSDFIEHFQLHPQIQQGNRMVCWIAALQGNLQLLEEIAPVAKDSWGRALAFAIYANQQDVIDWFLADESLQNNEIDLGLDAAVWQGRDDLFPIIMERQPSQEGLYKALLTAITTAREEIVVKLLLLRPLSPEEKQVVLQIAEQAQHAGILALLSSFKKV